MQSRLAAKVEGIKPKAGFLLIHGIICLVGALLPFYLPIIIFYIAVKASFAVKVIIVLGLGSIQAMTGAYWLLETKHRRPKWYWFLVAGLVVPGLILIFPAIHPPGLFNR